MRKTSKKTAPKVTKKTTRVTRKKTTSNNNVILFRRVFLITTCLLLVFVAALDVGKKGVTQSVAGVSIARGLFNQTLITLPRIDGAVSYNIYYKESSDGRYIHAVRNLPATTTTYLLSYLKKGKRYHYRISALDRNGKEFWWSKETLLTNTQGM